MMLEKLKWDEQPEDAAKEVQNLIDQLVDAVNRHEDIIRQIGEWGSSKNECLWCEKLTEVKLDTVNELQKNATISKMEKVETPPENVQSDTETRPENVHAVCPAVKYMGKVCRFWNGGNGKKFKNIGVLIEILSADNKRRYTCASKPKKHFEFCEPVKPDDDVIYKGGNDVSK